MPSGEDLEAEAGAVFVYSYTSAGSWMPQQKVIATGTNARISGDKFGAAVQLYGDTMAVGAPYQEWDGDGANSITDGGAVFVYTRSGATWSLQQKVVATGTNGRYTQSYFGNDVSLDENVMVVGSDAYRWDAAGTDGIALSAWRRVIYALGGQLTSKVSVTGRTPEMLRIPSQEFHQRDTVAVDRHSRL